MKRRCRPWRRIRRRVRNNIQLRQTLFLWGIRRGPRRRLSFQVSGRVGLPSRGPSIKMRRVERNPRGGRGFRVSGRRWFRLSQKILFI